MEKWKISKHSVFKHIHFFSSSQSKFPSYAVVFIFWCGDLGDPSTCDPFYLWIFIWDAQLLKNDILQSNDVTLSRWIQAIVEKEILFSFKISWQFKRDNLFLRKRSLMSSEDFIYFALNSSVRTKRERERKRNLKCNKVVKT